MRFLIVLLKYIFPSRSLSKFWIAEKLCDQGIRVGTIWKGAAFKVRDLQRE